jgi:hypothetical protein
VHNWGEIYRILKNKGIIGEKQWEK